MTALPGGPIGAARRAAAEREQQPARKLLDQMTERELARLYQRVEIAEAVARDLDGATNAAVRAIQLMNEAGSERGAAEQRAVQAEGAVERVLAFVARLDDMADTTISIDDRSLYRALAADLRAAVTQPGEPAP